MPESLGTITEFAAALAGFSGIVVALGDRPGMLHPIDRFRVMALLASSLGAALLSLVPVALVDVGLSVSLSWRSASGVFAAYATVVTVWLVRQRFALGPEDLLNLHPGMWLLGLGGFLGTIVSQTWNVVSTTPSGDAYLFCLLFLLTLGSLLFVRLLLNRPAAPLPTGDVSAPRSDTVEASP